MCGFVCFFDNTEVCLKKTIIKNMADRIVHRAPDSARCYFDDNVAIGFRCLSIIDIKGAISPPIVKTKLKY